MMPWSAEKHDFIVAFNTIPELYFLSFLSMLKFSNIARERRNFADAESLPSLLFVLAKLLQWFVPH